MHFFKTDRALSGRAMCRKGFSGAVILSCAALSLSLPVTADALVDANKSESQQGVPNEKADPYAEFLAKYADWARSLEAEGQKRGTPLTGQQIELAKEIGIKRPENVRLIFVESVPFPTDDEAMRKIGEALGFIGPGVTNNAQAFGYTIWVRNGYTLDCAKLAHELVHVMQIERSGDFAEFVKQYMVQLRAHGHWSMPLEVEAYEANEKYKCASCD